MKGQVAIREALQMQKLLLMFDYISVRMDFQVCRRPRKIKLVLSDWVDLKIKLEIS